MLALEGIDYLGLSDKLARGCYIFYDICYGLYS